MATLANFDTYAGYYAQLVNNQAPPTSAFMREYYRVLYAYYLQNGLYDYLNQELSATKTTNQALKPIRNPAWRVTEFYATKLFPGTLPNALKIETENPGIVEDIHKLWVWSNFSTVKQKWARWFAIYGDWFIKISTKGAPVTSVFMSLIRPEHVTDMELDERGFLTYVRIDVPIDEDKDGTSDSVYTEEWNKETQTLKIWQHTQGLDKKISELPVPDSIVSFNELHGEDFIPIVYQPFRDDGGGRGSGAYAAQLDKIDEANRQATRLAQILFRYNRAVWAATSNGTDASGRPLPPISLENQLDSDGNIQIGDDDVLSLPAMSELKSLVPNINYADALQVLESQITELTRDLPELAFYELRSMRDLSGRAARFLLDDMISRVVEARGNAEAALVRAHAMALTIGQNVKIFSSTGSYKDGDFDHSFTRRDILPEDRLEQAQVIQTLAGAGAGLFAAGRAAGMNEEQANDLAAVDLFEQEIGGR